MADYNIPIILDTQNVLKGIKDFENGFDNLIKKSKEVNSALNEPFVQSVSTMTKVEQVLKPIPTSLEQIQTTAKVTGKTFEDIITAKSAKSINEMSANLAGLRDRLIDSKTEVVKYRNELASLRELESKLKSDQSKVVQGTDNWKATTDQLNKVRYAIQGIQEDLEASKVNASDAQREYNNLTKEFEKLTKSDIEIDFTDVVSQVEELKQKLQEIDNQEIEPENIQLMDSLFNTTNATVNELSDAIQNAKQALSGMDENSAEFQELSEKINIAEEAVNKYKEQSKDTATTSVSLRTELNKIKEELTLLAQAGDTTSPKFIDLTQRATELQGQINNTTIQINKMSSSTKTIDGLISGVQGLTGAFAVGQGAMALFGSENKDLEESLLKVNGAMAILQGLQTIMNTLNKNSALSVAFLNSGLKNQATTTSTLTGVTQAQTVATGGATIATKAMSLALKTLGIGLIITAIAYLIEYWDDLTAEVNKFLPAGASVSKVFDEIKAQAFGVGNAILSYIVAPFKAIGKLLEGDWKGAALEAQKGFNFIDNFKSEYHNQQQRNDEKRADEREDQAIKDEAREIERRKNRGENVVKQEQKNKQREIDLLTKQGKDASDVRKSLEDMQDKEIAQRRQKDEQARKKAESEAKRRAEEARRKAQQEAKRNNDLLLKYNKDLINSQIELINDNTQKERKALEYRFNSRIEDIKKENPTLKSAIEAQTKLIESLETEKAQALWKFDFNLLKQRIKLRDESTKRILNYQKDSEAKELALLNLEHAEKINEIKNNFEKETELMLELITLQNEETDKKRKEIRGKWNAKELQKLQENEILKIEVLNKYGNENLMTEEQKQKAILQVKLSYAKLAVEKLEEDGTKEDNIQLLKARKLVNEIQEELGNIEAVHEFNIFDKLFGIDKLSSQQQRVIKQNAEIVKNSTKELTDFMVSQYDRQLDKKKEVIDGLDDEIKALESNLDDELKLKEAGFANNYELIEEELEAKKNQRDEELKQQEEIMKKKQEMQKLQLVMDTTTQLSSLVTASSKIFEAYASLPFIGQALAIAAITTMFAGFAVAKVKAFQAINDGGSEYGKGGFIRGKLHSEGGVKYYAEDGNNISLEDYEFVVNRKQSIKHSNLLEAINNNDYSKIGISDLISLGLDTSFIDNERIFNEENYNKPLNVLNNNIYNDKGIIKALKSLEGRVNNLTKLKEKEPISWEAEGYKFTKIDNTTFKTKLKPNANN